MKEKIKQVFTSKVNLPIWLITVTVLIFPTLFFVLKQNPLLTSKVMGWKIQFDPASDLDKYLPKIQKLMTLPEESPQFALVSDVEKVRNQPFFSKAENGDVVLVYQDSRKTILYRPSTNKIIEVGTINPPSPTAVPASPSATPTP